MINYLNGCDMLGDSSPPHVYKYKTFRDIPEGEWAHIHGKADLEELVPPGGMPWMRDEFEAEARENNKTALKFGLAGLAIFFLASLGILARKRKR